MNAADSAAVSKTRTSMPPQRGMARIAPFGAIAKLLRGFGVEPTSLLGRYGFSETMFLADPDATMPLALGCSLLKACAQATACPHFGLLVGQRADASSLGAVGLLLSNAPDVKTALEGLVTNLDLQDRGASVYLNVSEETCILGYEVYEHVMDGADQIYDCAMAICWNILRALCGPDWSPLEVRLRHEHPVDVAPYRRFFQAPLRFNAGHTSMVFSSRWLDQPIPRADPGLRQYFLDRVQEMRVLSNQTFRDQAHRILVALAANSQCSREHLANRLSMHPRTLNRRLKDAGTSFRELHNEARHEMACQLLRDTRRSMSAIALLLEYSDATAFNRAFSRWEGISPAKWRKQMHSKVTAPG